MDKNILETEELKFTIDDLREKKAEAELLEEKNRMVTKELEELINKNENEIER